MRAFAQLPKYIEDEDEFEHEDDRENSGSIRFSEVENGLRRGSVQERNPAKGKAVRELRQRRAYYRCCIPALAGFVSRRSIAPDGSIPMDQLEQKGNGFLAACPRICVWEGIWSLELRAWSFGLSVLGFGFSVVGRLKTVFARWLTQTQNLKH